MTDLGAIMEAANYLRAYLDSNIGVFSPRTLPSEAYQATIMTQVITFVCLFP